VRADTGRYQGSGNAPHMGQFATHLLGFMRAFRDDGGIMERVLAHRGARVRGVREHEDLGLKGIEEVGDLSAVDSLSSRIAQG